jgi:hypothetical protein
MKIEYIKYILILVFVCTVVYFVKDYQDKAQFKKDTIQNQLQYDRFDSLKVAYIVNTDRQLLNYIKSNKELSEALKLQGIKLNRVTSIMNHVLKYRDTTIVETDLSEVLLAINNKTPISKPFIDSTKCLVNKGLIKYENNALSLVFTERVFQGETTATGYWERNLWTIPVLKIKTRFLGKKQATAFVIDKCGESKIININIKAK